METIEDMRKEIVDKGNSIYHASRTIKNNHVAEQIELFQLTIRTGMDLKDINKCIKNIEIFRDAIEMTGKKLNSEFKEAILDYCDKSILYYQIIKPKDFECPNCGGILTHTSDTRYHCKKCNRNIVVTGVEVKDESV